MLASVGVWGEEWEEVGEGGGGRGGEPAQTAMTRENFTSQLFLIVEFNTTFTFVFLPFKILNLRSCKDVHFETRTINLKSLVLTISLLSIAQRLE